MPQLATLAGLVAAMAFGAMLLFSFAVAPLVFLKLPAETAGGFIRQLFPVYYLVLAAATALAALLTGASWEAAILWLVAALFLALRYGLIPALDRTREKNRAAFARLHRLSVVVNAVQMLLLAGVALRLAA